MRSRSSRTELLRLKLRIQHSDCWTLEVTEDTRGKLLGHGAGVSDTGKAKGRFTAYGDTVEDVEALVEAARSSSLTDTVLELHNEFTLNRALPPGTPTQELFVEYESSNSIDPVLAAKGFIRDEPNKISDGEETWRVVVHADREGLRRRLAEVRNRMDAEIDVAKIRSSKQIADDEGGTGLLSNRQREIFEYAQQRNYYTWPRDVTVAQLAEDLDVSKTTVLEHLRKAEAKILGSY